MQPLTLTHPMADTDHESDVLWHALLGTTDSMVLVLDPAGIISAANAPAKELLSLDDGSLGAATRLDSVMPSPLAGELSKAARSSSETDTPLLVETVLKGRWLRLTLRPCDYGGARAVLAVASLGHDSQADPSLRRIRTTNDDLGDLGALTPRELEILRLIALGLSTNDIAKVLFRSVKTVEGHRVSLGAKLKVTNRVELARIALRCGIITLDTPAPVISDTDES